MNGEGDSVPCLRCNREMTLGLLATQGAWWPPSWVSQATVRSIGLFAFKAPKHRQLVAYCCESCGYVESRALPEGVKAQALLKGAALPS